MKAVVYPELKCTPLKFFNEQAILNADGNDNTTEYLIGPCGHSYKLLRYDGLKYPETSGVKSQILNDTFSYRVDERIEVWEGQEKGAWKPILLKSYGKFKSDKNAVKV